MRDRGLFAGTALAVLAAGVLGKTSPGSVIAFLFAAAALSLLAMVVGHATDQLGSRLGPGATGVLQSALGNLPELFVCIFALKAGLVEVVKSALIGSVLANSLLVLGLAFLIGGLKHGTQRFVSEPPRTIAILMLLAVGAMSIPSIAYYVHTPAADHEAGLSGACAIVLLVVFLCSLSFSLKGNPAVAPHPHDPPTRSWPLTYSVGLLALAGIGAAFVSEWFVDAMMPATKALGLSEAFTGLVVVAIAGNAIENVVGIALAARNKSDYAVSVILNSSLQVAVALVPVLVILSFFVGPAPMALVFSPMLLVSLALSAIIGAFVTFDGESIWLEGVALIGLYAMIAASFWWG